MDFSLLKNDPYHSVFHLREDQTGISLIDDIEIHFLELPKLNAQSVQLAQGGLANWLLFLKGVTPDQWEVLTMNEPELKKSMDTLEFLSQDQEARMRYEARQKYLHDQASLMEAAKNAELYGFKAGMERGLEEGIEKGLAQGIERGLEEGIEKGMEKGMEKGIEQGIQQTALRLLKLGLDTQTISEATGLSEQEIRSLSNTSS